MKTENKLENKLEFGLKDALIPFNFIRKNWAGRKSKNQREENYVLICGGISGVISGAIILYSLFSLNYGTLNSKKWSEIQTQKQVQQEIQIQKNSYELLQKYDSDNNGSLDSAEFFNYYKERFD